MTLRNTVRRPTLQCQLALALFFGGRLGQNWTAELAYGINSAGEIAGTATNNSTAEGRVFLYDPSTDQIMLMSQVALPVWHIIGHAINDDCDIVGHVEDEGKVNVTAIFFRSSDGVYAGWDLGIAANSSINMNKTHINNRAAG